MYDGPTINDVSIEGKLCGNFDPSTNRDIYSSGTSLTMMFKTDHNIILRGFKISYEIMASSEKPKGRSMLILSFIHYFNNYQYYK